MNIDDSRPAPLSLPVGHEVPRGARLLRVCDGYKDLPDAIPCGLANCHTPHKTGFVVAFAREDGTEGEGLVGHVCGKNFFGADWTSQMRAHGNRVRIAELHGRAEGALADCETVSPLLTRVRVILDALDAAQRAIVTAAPEVHRLGVDAARSNRQAYLGEGASGPRFLTMQGVSFWTRERFHQKANRLEADIRILRQKVNDPHLTVAKLGMMLTSFGSARMRTQEIIDDTASDLRALYQPHFEDVVAAMRSTSANHRFRIIHGRLQHVVPGQKPGDEHMWVDALNVRALQPFFAEVEALRNALTVAQAA